jgi:hypothetical protein
MVRAPLTQNTPQSDEFIYRMWKDRDGEDVVDLTGDIRALAQLLLKRSKPPADVC